MNNSYTKKLAKFDFVFEQMIIYKNFKISFIFTS